MIAWLSVPWRSKALEAYVQLQLNIYGKMIWSHCGVEILSSYLMSEPLGKYLDLSLPPPGYALLFDVWWHLLQQAGSGALFSCSTQILLKFFFDVLFFFFLCLNNFYQALRGFHLFILNSNWLSVGYLQLLSFWFQLVLIFFFCIFCYYPMPVLHIITEDTCYQDTTCSHSNLRLVKSLTSSYYEALQISFKTCGLSLSMAML